MEKGIESWFRDQKIDPKSLNPNASRVPFGVGPRVTIPSFGNTVSPKANVREEPCGWFFGLPRNRCGFVPVVNSIKNGQFVPVAGPEAAQAINEVPKKFIVFDQSGDQITHFQYQFPSSNNPELLLQSKPVYIDDYIEENEGDDSRSEMQENTEDLNALLYSDSDDDDDNDYFENDETSTGHSPSLIPGIVEQKWQNESGEEEEVASSGRPMKRRKREDGRFIIDSLEDTAISGKSAINSSGNDGNGASEEESNNVSSRNKRLRKEKVMETINVLHSLIPGDKNGKNAMVAIDEAIDYLRKLKVKAKALGLDSL